MQLCRTTGGYAFHFYSIYYILFNFHSHTYSINVHTILLSMEIKSINQSYLALLLHDVHEWLAAWAGLECGVGFVEFDFHGFNPIGATWTDLENAFVHLYLSGKGVVHFVVAHQLNDLQRPFWEDVQSGHDG